MPANNARMTKAERREAARKEAARLAAKQAAAERRNRLIIVVASVVVVALVGVAGFFIYQAAGRTLLTEFNGARPAGSTDSGGITFGESLAAGTTNPDAPVVDLYIDFMCPFCGQFDQVNREDIRAMALFGEATVSIHPLDILDDLSQGTQYSTRAANAFATVATDAPEFALPFLEALFDNQPQEQTPGLTDEEIATIAVGAGVPQAVADSFVNATYTEWVGVAADQAANDGAASTPTIVIDGERWAEDWQVAGAFYTAVTGNEGHDPLPSTTPAATATTPADGATTPADGATTPAEPTTDAATESASNG